MKIAILMGTLQIGGAERVATTLASYLSNHNVDTYLISFANEESSYTLDSKINFIKNKGNMNLNRIKGIRQRIKFMFNILDEIKPDLVFTMFWNINLYALVYKIFGKNRIKLISSEGANPNQIKEIKKLLNNISSKYSDGFIFQTERAKACYSRKVQEKCIVIHNAIGNPNINKVHKEVIMSEKMITTMGRLEYQKAHDVMMKACAPVLRDNPEYKLVIFGEGSLRSELENLIKELDMQHNIFLPGSTQNAIYEVAKSQIFLLTSRYEGMPNALMEAMALGIPCVSTNCDMGPAELIRDGIDGYLVPVDDINSITQKVRILLSDEQLRERISENCKKINETHSVDKIYGEYLKYFIKIIGGNNDRNNI